MIGVRRVEPHLRRVTASSGLLVSLAKLGYGIGKTAKDSLAHRQFVVTRWWMTEQRWHYRWPEGRAISAGRWRDAMGWATRGFYYGMDDLLWSRYRPKGGDVVLDIGAGDGGETFYLASMVGPNGRVISVEAAPRPFHALLELQRINGWTQVEPVHAAVSDAAGSLRISNDDAWVAGNVFESPTGVEVQALTIDELCEQRGIDHVNWVKMNIEGAERQALLGMERMAAHVDHLTISCHDFLGTDWGRTLEDVLTWLSDHGFEAEQRDEGDFVQRLYVYAKRQDS